MKSLSLILLLLVVAVVANAQSFQSSLLDKDYNQSATLNPNASPASHGWGQFQNVANNRLLSKWGKSEEFEWQNNAWQAKYTKYYTYDSLANTKQEVHLSMPSLDTSLIIKCVYNKRNQIILVNYFNKNGQNNPPILVNEQSYSYDSLGNQIKSSYISYSNSQIIFGLKNFYTYDNNGNFTSSEGYRFINQQWIFDNGRKDYYFYDTNNFLDSMNSFLWHRNQNRYLIRRKINFIRSRINLI
jgi:hypothetical protein